MKTLLVALFLTGCAAPKPGGPPEIVFGRHECARCGMIVSEERFAAGYVADDGETAAFDDAGELLAAVEGRPELRAKSWVRDLKGAGWVRLADASLVRVDGLATPMGTGWVAFARSEEADAFVRSRAPRRALVAP